MADKAVKPCPFCKETPSVGLCGSRVMHDCKALGAFISSTVEGWNTRAEQTCKLNWEGSVFAFVCDSCDMMTMMPPSSHPNYCPSCGAKAVS